MTEDERIDWTLAWATNPRAERAADGADKQEIDTSCAWVPFGFVHLIKKTLRREEDARDFWAACIRRDELVDPLAATLVRLGVGRLTSILHEIQKDTLRVGDEVRLVAAGEWSECFRLNGGCGDCCGAVLLLRYQLVQSTFTGIESLDGASLPIRYCLQSSG